MSVIRKLAATTLRGVADGLRWTANTALPATRNAAVQAYDDSAKLVGQAAEWTTSKGLPTAKKATGDAYEATAAFASVALKDLSDAIRPNKVEVRPTDQDTLPRSEAPSTANGAEKEQLANSTFCAYKGCSTRCSTGYRFCNLHYDAELAQQVERARREERARYICTNCGSYCGPGSERCARCAESFGAYKQRRHGKKKQHVDRDAAFEHMQDLARKERKPIEAFEIYSCEFCDHYHVGHKKERTEVIGLR